VVLTISPDGTVDFDRDFEVVLRSEFNLRNFPFDRGPENRNGVVCLSAGEVILEPIPDQMRLGRI
jgi:hypothetical protein